MVVKFGRVQDRKREKGGKDGESLGRIVGGFVIQECGRRIIIAKGWGPPPMRNAREPKLFMLLAIFVRPASLARWREGLRWIPLGPLQYGDVDMVRANPTSPLCN